MSIAKRRKRRIPESRNARNINPTGEATDALATTQPEIARMNGFRTAWTLGLLAFAMSVHGQDARLDAGLIDERDGACGRESGVMQS